MKSWCDKLSSLPAIGVKLSPHFVPADVLINALSPIIDKLVDGDKQKFSLENALSAFSGGFNTEEGFKYDFDHSKISVAFNHRVRFTNVSGGYPTMEMLSKPLLFTALMPIVANRVIEAALLLPKIHERTVERVGVVSTTPISFEDAPPGVQRLINYLGRPWNGLLDNFQVQLSGRISETVAAYDRCVHTIIKPEGNEEELLTVIFDWQRTFRSGENATKEHLKNVLADAEKASLTYFEQLAEGSMFDEAILSHSTKV